jgi:polyhydroxybutyrate depolymerase
VFYICSKGASMEHRASSNRGLPGLSFGMVGLVSCAWLVACGSRATASDGNAPEAHDAQSPPADVVALDTSVAPPDTAPSIPDTSIPEPICHADGLPPGDHDFTLSHAGKDRRYRVYVPPGIGAHELVPLLIDMHPLVLDGPSMELFSNMKPAADKHRMIVAYPSGLGGSWNAGVCCAPATTNKEDDVGFIREMVAAVEAKVCIDAKRVYATGHSNGAFLSHRLACEASDLITAIAPASGTIGIPLDECKPLRPVPVLHFHGTADPLVPYGGGNGASVPDTISFWATHDGCTDAPTSTYTKGAVHCEARTKCASGSQVELCTAEGGGHCWPGSATCPVGAPITDIDGDEYMMKFFERFRLP